ncbi:MAG TPA: hypothetical protein VEP90_13520 [Methylomirabilota bacterium]|nr:hypothetical protein [Methylomirabilota bacterium]
MKELDEGLQQVKIVGGFKGAQVIDTTLEIICKRCIRSLGMSEILNDAEVKASLK